MRPSRSPISWWIWKQHSQCCSLPTHSLPLTHVLLTGEGCPVWLLLLMQDVSFDSFYQKVCFSLILMRPTLCGGHTGSPTEQEPTSSYPGFSFQLKYSVLSLSKHNTLSLSTFRLQSLHLGMEMGWLYMESKYLRWNSYMQANAHAHCCTLLLSVTSLLISQYNGNIWLLNSPLWLQML